MKEVEVCELRGALSGTVLHLEGNATELHESLEHERVHRREAEQLFVWLYTEHNA